MTSFNITRVEWPRLPSPSDQTLLSFYVNFAHFSTVLITLMGSLGCVLNVFNLVVFRAMGLHESGNITFFGLAASDLFSNIFTSLNSLSMTPTFRYLFFKISLNMSDFGNVVFSLPLLMFSMLSAIITAYIAVQRCLSVVIPFKIKYIFTANKTKLFILLAVVFVVVVRGPLFFVFNLGWVDNPLTNVSYTGMVLNSVIGPPSVIRRVFLVIQVTVTFSSNAIIVVCTVVLWAYLIAHSARSESTLGKVKADSDASSSNKEMKVIKNVVFVCTLHLAGSLPSLVLMMIVFLDISKFGAITNPIDAAFYDFLYQVSNIFQAVNTSFNTLIYYNTSSRYFATFNQKFSCTKHKRNG